MGKDGSKRNTFCFTTMLKSQFFSKQNILKDVCKMNKVRRTQSRLSPYLDVHPKKIIFYWFIQFLVGILAMLKFKLSEKSWNKKCSVLGPLSSPDRFPIHIGIPSIQIKFVLGIALVRLYKCVRMLLLLFTNDSNDASSYVQNFVLRISNSMG